MNNLNIRLALTAILLLSLHTSEIYAQKHPGDFAIGAQFGQPTGLTIQLYRPTTSIDFLAAWDLDDFFFLNMHLLFDTGLNNRNTVNFFYGPGAYIGIRDRDPLEDEVELGLSGSFGIDFMIRKFQIFFQATPRLSLVESTNFDMGGGVGFRIYL